MSRAYLEPDFDSLGRAWTEEAWRQTERPDADPDPDDPQAETPCEACRLPTLLDDLWLTAKGSRVCPACWFRGHELPPLPEAE